jgi:hypothetical protein
LDSRQVEAPQDHGSDNELVLEGLVAELGAKSRDDRFFATHILAFEGDRHAEWFEGNFADYEEDKKRRLGGDSVNLRRLEYKNAFALKGAWVDLPIADRSGLCTIAPLKLRSRAAPNLRPDGCVVSGRPLNLQFISSEWSLRRLSRNKFLYL